MSHLNKAALFKTATLVFLVINLVVRFATILRYPPYNGYVAAFLGCLVAACIFTVFFRRFLNTFFFLFGFSFFLFGFPSIDLQSRLFEITVTCVSLTLFVINCGAKETHGTNTRLRVLILCYTALSLFSLMLMPVGQIIRDLSLFGFMDFFFYSSINPAYGFYYPIMAVNRLILFVILAVELARSNSHATPFKPIFIGLFSGAIFCAFIGLMDFYGIISLAWYRFGKTTTPGVLHSTFGNRGVFCEFVLTVVPFVLIGFMERTNRLWMHILLFGSLVICEIALILAGARAGWVSYPLILFLCWLFFYFSREGRFESLHIKWGDLVKVGISVPVTIIISFLIIFKILMPLADYLKQETGIKGIQRGADTTAQYIERQASRLIEPSKRGRLYTWGEGYNVGRENPVFGMGYESFCWHANILGDIPGSHLNRFYSREKYIHLTPHSIFFQMFASGGIVGLCLWLLIVAYTVMILFFDFIKHRRLLNIPVIISIISFHVYGVFQSMQTFPMIWCLIFLSLAYAMTIDDDVVSPRIRRIMGVLTGTSVALVIIGFFVYLSNFESRGLAQKYGKQIYAADQERDRFAGFFQRSQRWKYGDYRWFGKKGAIHIPDGGDIQIEFHCRTPGLEKEPLVLTIFHAGRVVDKITFSGGGGEEKGRKHKTLNQTRGKKVAGFTVRRKYKLPLTPGETQELILAVSRIWIPHNVLGNFDRRELGLGVKIVHRKHS